MHLTDNYICQRLSEQNFPDFVRLFHSVNGKKIRKDFLRIKYETSYTGLIHLGYIAYSNDKPVSYYGVIPNFLVYKGEKKLVAQSVDTMTHHEHRRQGLSQKLALLCYELCRENGIEVIYGFANEYSGPMFLDKLNFKLHSRMQYFNIEIGTSIFAKAARKILHYTGFFLKKSNCKKPDKSNFIGLIQDSSFLNYKMSYSQAFIKRIRNSHVLLKENNSSLEVGDIDLDSNDSLEEIALLITEFGKKRLLSRVIFQCTLNSSIFFSLKKNLNPRPTWDIVYLPLNLSFPFEEVEFTLADVDIF